MKPLFPRNLPLSNIFVHDVSTYGHQKDKIFLWAFRIYSPMEKNDAPIDWMTKYITVEHLAC